MIGLLSCIVCGVGFRGRSDAIYCSQACRQKAHRSRTAQRIAELAVRRRPRLRTAKVVTKPDVASTIRRAQDEQRRAHELCRTAADTVRQSAEFQQQSAIHRVARATEPDTGGGS